MKTKFFLYQNDVFFYLITICSLSGNKAIEHIIQENA